MTSITSSLSFRVLVALLVAQAWEDSTAGDDSSSSPNPDNQRRHRTISDDVDSIAVDPRAHASRAAGAHGRKSRLSASSSSGMEPDSDESDDQAVLTAMGLGSDQRSKSAAPPFAKRAALFADDDHEESGTPAGRIEDSNDSGHEDLDSYDTPNMLLQDSDTENLAYWDRRRRRRRVDCTYKTWTPWTPCSLTCAGGIKQQKRGRHGPYHFGKGCYWDYTLKQEACNSAPCPVNCAMTPWGGWGACSVTCGFGTKTRSREKDGPFHGGAACTESTSSSAACNTFECPVDCYFQPWSAFGACSKTCIAEGNFGYKTRDRGKVGPSFGGVHCVGHSTDDGLCNTFTCPYDCDAGEWGQWSVCTQTCSISIVHHGYHMRSRTSVPAANGGRPCSNNEQLVHCHTELCPVDCYWLVWGAWGPCSKTCTPASSASGIRIAVRDKVGPMGAGVDCDGATTRTTSCNDFNCPVDCTFKEWGEWGACSKTCATGIRTRNRGKNEAQFGGTDCVGQTIHSEMCESWTCPVDCLWSMWDAWMPCTKSCGGGNQHRSRAYDPKPESGGLACAGAHMEMIECKAQPCPIDCAFEEWLDWSLCGASCGTGRRIRVRLVRVAATFGGQECDHENGVVHEEACPEQEPCPEDCKFSEWGEWLPCNASCEKEGHRPANRTLLLAENGGSSICPEGPLERAMSCTGKACTDIKAAANLRYRLSALAMLMVAVLNLNY